MRAISPADLRTALMDGHELALLDAREEGEFGASHLFWAVPCPLSRREARAAALLPNLSTRIVCVDGGEGYAAALAGYLEGIGCSDVSVLAGGTQGWAAAGYELFSGVNVPSKAFGEWVEHHYGTESIDAEELAAWRDAGRDVVILDSRPFDEFVRMSIPGGVNVPGGELAYRVRDLAPDPATTIVVNCAGRTRSILGAESLRRAGVANRVVALRNGTMGWELAGFTAARGMTERFAAGRPASGAAARAGAAAWAEECGVGVIGALDLARFEADEARSCYVLDVREASEFAAGHHPGAIHAPGGQLVQATDRWVGVRGARIVLLDDDGVRARMTAGWLRRMGHADVFVADDVDMSATDVAVETDLPEVPTMTAEAASAALSDDPALRVIDVARSLEFRDRHVPGARWAVRGRMTAAVADAGPVVVTSPDGVLARRAVADLRADGVDAAALLGGTDAWVGAGLPVEASRNEPPDAACVDAYLRPYDRNEGVEDAMRDYLSWEIALVEQIKRDGTVRFGSAA